MSSHPISFFNGLMTLLLKLNLNHHTAQSIIHGPLMYNGIELPNLYKYQGTNQLKYLMGHLQAQDKSCKLIHHGYLQLLVGIRTNYVNSDYCKYSKWINMSWLKSIWGFINKIKLKIYYGESMVTSPCSWQWHQSNGVFHVPGSPNQPPSAFKPLQSVPSGFAPIQYYFCGWYPDHASNPNRSETNWFP